MTVDEFLVWLEDKADRTRYELIAGQPVAMAREPVAHARTKAQLWLVLRDGLELQRLPGEALPDGMTVKIDEHTAYQPDAVVHCDQPSPDDAIIVPAPVIAVEVLSPTTKAHECGRQARRLLPPAERAPLPPGPDRAADGDPSSPRRRRQHRDPGRHRRRARSRPAGPDPGACPDLRLKGAARIACAD